MLSENPDFEVKPIKRQANMVTHTLDRAAVSWARRHIFALISPCIDTYLHNNEMI
jgi:hypothetical protein